MKFVLNNYQAQALETAVYPGRYTGIGIAYCALKLSGEAGELLEKILNVRLTDPLEVLKELGDIMWYVAALSTELKSEIPYDPLRLSLTAHDVVIKATQVAELVGKALRDDGLGSLHVPGKLRYDDTTPYKAGQDEITSERRDQILERLASITQGVDAVARGLGYSMQDVCDTNIAKLRSRAKRGVLAGSGDNR